MDQYSTPRCLKLQKSGRKSHKSPTVSDLPENNNNRTLTAGDNHQSFPDHQRRGNYHTKVQHLVIQLKQKRICINNNGSTHKCSSLTISGMIQPESLETCNLVSLGFFNHMFEIKFNSQIRFYTHLALDSS